MSLDFVKRIAKSNVPGWTLFVSCSATLVAATGWFISWYPRATTWGSAFTGIAAAVTLLAVVVALMQATIARQVANEDRAARTKSEMDAEARRLHEHASLISWWCDFIREETASDNPNSIPAGIRPFLDFSEMSEPRLDDAPDIVEPPGVWLARVRIENLSDSPVFDAVIRPRGARAHDRPIGVIPPGTIYVQLRLLDSGTTSGRGEILASAGRNSWAEYLDFTDRERRRWRRHRDGTLEPLESD